MAITRTNRVRQESSVNTSDAKVHVNVSGPASMPYLPTTPKNPYAAGEAPPVPTPGSGLRSPSWCVPRVLVCVRFLC